jgi:diguanylate cyclase (GGDEF)-like protein/PAS domain S-box-containing protein
LGFLMNNLFVSLILNTLPYAVWVSDEYSKVILTNTVFNELIGEIAENIKVDDLLSYIHPEDLEGFRKVRDTARNNREAYQYALRLQKPGGGYVWYHVTENPMHNSEGSFCGYIGTFTEIPFYVPDFIEELYLEDVINTVFKNGDIGVLIINRDGYITDCSKHCESITGRSKNQLCGHQWFRFIHPEDTAGEMENLADLMHMEKNSYSSVRRYIKPDQSIVWIGILAFHVKQKDEEKDNKIAALVIKDISPYIKTAVQTGTLERFLSVLWSDVPGMIYRCNPDWSMNYVSEGCQRLTGYNRKLFLQFRHYYFNTVVNEEYREYLQKRREEAIRKKTRFKEEYMITAASGKQKWVYEQAYGVFNTDGELIYIDGAVSDITEMKQKEYEYIKRQYRDPLTGLNNRRFLEAAGRNLDRNGILPVAVVVVKIDGIQMVKETFGHKMSDALLVSLSRMLTDNLKDKDKDVLAIIGEDEFCILIPEAGSGQVSDYIRHVRTQLKKSREEIFSNTNLITVYFGYDIKKQADETIASAIQKARQNMYDPDTDLCVHTFPKVVSRHQTFSFPKDRGFRMVRWCRKVGQRLNLDPADMNRLELLALIQNIGLALVSSYILYKADRLTQTEWEMIKKHPEAGYRIALSSPELSDVAEEVLYHHEWWNGDGYPKGLKGEEIPLLSRIIAVIDAFDAMISDRPYRPALTKEEALEELRKNAGIRFDPRIVKIFFEAIQEESD